ncbi:hypothetical protein Ddye_016218 [Dipteronia dyeriana]|uniref:Reverse transcriptase domain-containing protein n=1 Tax=Dipteronia dyeriana TaxID=168575 RepID=A0AAD9U6W2_9ROSI|nr:hypothetical protein Ddye_016218 [Dipteronia dyeriana]
MLFFMETKTDHVFLEDIRVRLGFDGKLVMDATGICGGLCFFWSHSDKKYWPIVGEKVIKACLGVLNEGEGLEMVNKTLIIMIPKVKRLERISRFRPISLGNVIYKNCSEAFTNRFRNVLDEVISETQSAFIPGRLILDNGIVGFECMHALRRKKKGKKGSLALKLDMSKAYDRMEWDFLSGMMTRLGFSASWVNRIMRCVQSFFFSHLINGEVYGLMKPSRGLRQGDPLYPYLFLICVEDLSQLLQIVERSRKLMGFQCSRGGPKITHLFFADDSMIFTLAVEKDCQIISQVLNVYEKASGQVVNFQKSAICVSKGVSKHKALAQILGVRLVRCHERYLGFPSFAGQNKREMFTNIEIGCGRE